MTQDRTWAGLRAALAEYRAAEASKAELYRKEKLPHWESCNAYERKEKASDNLAAAAQAVLDAAEAKPGLAALLFGSATEDSGAHKVTP
jgi:hypothetical protein